jgi:V8-like Glu-specific endopeptidase
MKLLEENFQEKVEELHREIAENNREIAENNREIAENNREIADLQSILPQRYIENTKRSNFLILDPLQEKEIGIGFFILPDTAITAFHVVKDNGYIFSSIVYARVLPNRNIIEMTIKSLPRLEQAINEFDVCVMKTITYQSPSHLTIPSSSEIVVQKPKQTCVTTFHIAMTEEVKNNDIISVGFGIVEATIIKVSKNHFIYSSTLFDGDSGGALVYCDGSVVGLHQEAVNRAKEKLEHGHYELEDVADSVNGITAGYSQCFLGLRLDSDIVKRLVAL